MSEKTCHDCQKTDQVWHMYAVRINNKEETFYKCEECFRKDSKLKNFRPVECYSRIVGYMRPIENWNIGKAQEFKDRVVFNN